MRKALIIIPDDLERTYGFMHGVHALSRILKSIGFTVDAAACGLGPRGIPPEYKGLYKNIYYPHGNSPFIRQLDENTRQLFSTINQQDYTNATNFSISLAGLVNMQPYDLYVIHHIPCDYFKYLLPQNSKKILFAHYYQSVLDGDLKFYAKKQVEKNLEREIGNCKGYDLVTVTGEKDRRLFLKYRPEANVMHQPHCLKIKQLHKPAANAKRILMTGFDNPPNRTALNFYFEEVYPLLSKIDPTIETHITSNIKTYGSRHWQRDGECYYRDSWISKAPSKPAKESIPIY